MKCLQPFQILNDEKLGRYLVATRDIKLGEVILQEPPLIWGPTQVTVPVCLGCGTAIKEDNYKPCTKCGWPVCSEICEKSPSHIPECQYTVSKGSKVCISTFGTIHPTYQCITVLRCLYQKQFLSDIWKKLDRLQSHCEERKISGKYEKDRIMVAQFILGFFKLRNIFTEEEVLRVCGIVTINGHEVPLTTPSHVAIYESTSMFEHRCSANCNKTFTDQGSILIKCGTHIKKGEHLSICYTDPLWGTANRRHHLYESKFFWCSCERCTDPTEFSTYFSAMRCQNGNCTGYLLPPTFIINNVNEKLPDWKCNKCSSVSSAHHMQDLLDRIGQDLQDLPKGESRAAKDFIKTYEKYLHNNHYYLTDVRFALTQLMGHEDQRGLPGLDEDDVELKARLCQGLSKLIQILAPGETRMRGLVLYELHATIAELGRRGGDPHQLTFALHEAKKVLQEAAELLKNEPACLQEGKVYKQALKNIKEIDVVLMTLHTNIGSSPS
ncbi:SET domain-containing protein SmydA-8-like isoform X2 [Sitophilus oryzae]|uniref:SET domain-containing protein SmydA-8-like isoform X2 n=1 Tax=Sitophilus oryzae TaxID=7048 RepID=A0A6J2YCF2_SITOR|nr:SET domain-containing protein SmydA-8-like isoform X2 [Sitophilus oryzae]